MRTTKAVIENSNIDPKLVRAVVRATGRDNLEDIARHGAAGGFAGFTYYTDTVAFFKRNRREIVKLVESMADELGQTPVEMVAGFQCLAGQHMQHGGFGGPDAATERNNRRLLNEYLPSVSRCLYGGRLTEEDTQAANALAWFAAEEVARAFNPDL